MDDYISREAVLRCIKESKDAFDWGQSEDGDAFKHYAAALYRTIAYQKIFPAADVRPVVHGKWVPDDKEIAVHCSECGAAEWYINRGKFCPNCGAKMDGR